MQPKRNEMIQRYIILLCIALLALSCDNGKGDKVNELIDGGHGIGIDTISLHKIEKHEDSIKAVHPAN